MKKINYTRNKYDEIELSSMNPKSRKRVENLVSLVAKNINPDDYGSWTFGANFNYSGSGVGTALNWSLYAYGKDYYHKRFLCVIQVRQFRRIKRSYYPNILKNYYLLGRNEDDTVFAHPISSQVVRTAIKNNKDVIHAVQSYIFQFDYKKLIRQGNIALIPKEKPKGNLLPLKEIIIDQSHKVIGTDIYKYQNKTDDTYYVINPIVQHLPMIRDTIEVHGCYRINIGLEAASWMFLSPYDD